VFDDCAAGGVRLMQATRRRTRSDRSKWLRGSQNSRSRRLHRCVIDFGDAEDEVALEMIEDFEQMVGKHQAIIASSSYWGEQSFPAANLRMIWRHRAMPLVYWSPWDKPYEQNRGPDKFNLNAIIDGVWDSYIDMWADAAREFGHPMIVAFGVEMNGDWFPWSGWYYGGEEWIDDKPDEWEGPERFKVAYRHVVDRVRGRGAKNIQ